jgi:hypothetical protein
MILCMQVTLVPLPPSTSADDFTVEVNRITGREAKELPALERKAVEALRYRSDSVAKSINRYFGI